MLQVTVLGPVRAHLDGVEVDLGGPRRRAFLGLLVAAGRRVVSADRACEDLWSGEAPPRALAALQAHVSHLRRVLEPERARRQPARVLRSVAPGYLLDVPDEAVDAWHVAALLREAAAAQDPRTVRDLTARALALWSDEPFAAHADEPWASTEATRLRGLHAAGVEAWAQASMELGDVGSSLPTLESHVIGHPLREEGVRLLALAQYRDGRQGDALATLAAARERLADELGLDPGPALRALEGDILAHADHLDAVARPAHPPEPIVPSAPAPAPAAGPDDRFVGRVAELDRLATALAAAREAGRARIAWVGADAGFGKSALVDRFCDQVASQAVVARGRCPEVDGAPAGWPWAEVLEHLDGVDVDAVATGAFALGRRVVAALAERADRPVVLVLDDLHVADDDTLQVLRQVLAAVVGPVLVVGTYRAHQVGPGLSLTLAALAEQTVDRIELGGLDQADAARLLERFGRRPLSADASAALVERSAGNPLFLREIGQLVSAEGPTAGLALPPVIRDLLARRLGRLPEPVVGLLSRAAVLGHDVDVDLLVAVERERDGLDEDAVLEALDGALVAGLLDLPAPGDLRFTHALIRDTCYDRLAPLQRRRLHQLALGVLERERPDRVDALAAHAAAGLDGRSATDAVEHLTAAATAARATGAWTDTVRHARAALSALDLAGPDPRRRLLLVRALADGLAGSGDVEGARACRREGVALAEEHGTRQDVADQLSWDVPTVWTVRSLADVDEGLVARLQDALEHLAPDSPADDALRVRLLSTLVLETDSSPLVPVAERAAEEALSLARTLDDPRLLCQALNAAYFVSFPPRADGRQRQVGEELLEVATAHGLVGYEAVAHHVLFGAAAGKGDLVRAGEHVRRALACGAAGQLPLLLVVAGLFAGAARLVQGDLDGAEAVYADVAARIEASGDSNGTAMGVVLAFTVAHARGDTSASVEPLAPYVERAQLRARDLSVRAMLDAGDLDAARDAWRDEPVWHDYLWGFFATVQAENAADLGKVEVCRRLRDELAPWAGRLAGLSSGSTTLGPVDHALGRLAAALGDTEAARRHFDDAAALARAFGNAAWERQAEASTASLR